LKNFIKNIGFSSAIYDQFGEQEDKQVDIEVDLSDDAEEEEEETGDSDDSNDTNGSESDEDEDDEEEADSDDAPEPSVVTKQVAPTEKVIKDKNANLVIIKEKWKPSV
jgi:hypothetical protein